MCDASQLESFVSRDVSLASIRRQYFKMEYELEEFYGIDASVVRVEIDEIKPQFESARGVQVIPKLSNGGEIFKGLNGTL